jgi:FkbM family methyltransferase
MRRATRSLKSTAKAVLPRPIWMKLGRLYDKYRVLSFHPRTAAHTYGGIYLKLLLADPVAADWYDSDQHERPEIALLKRSRLVPGALVFDLGAHQCVFAMMLANGVRPDGRVVALEAHPKHARVGEINCRCNGYNEVQVLNAAVAESSGTIAFASEGHVGIGRKQRRSLRVDSYSIDDLGERFGVPSVIYMDIEGYECRALAGAAKMLQEKIDWFVEVHVKHGLETFGGSAAQVLAFFPRESYELYIGAESDPELVRLHACDPRLQDRFFLVALHE